MVAWSKLLVRGFILGIALLVTLFLTTLFMGFIVGFLPLDLLGEFSSWAVLGIQILVMGLVATVILRYIHP